MFPEVVEHLGIEVYPGVPATNAVGAAGIIEHFKRLFGVNKLLHKLCGVLRMNIIIARGVDDQKMSLQIIHVGKNRSGIITRLIILR